MKILQLFILILTFSLSSSAQTSVFNTAKGAGKGSEGDYAKWNFAIGKNQYEIKNDGKGKRTNTSTVFKLPLNKGEMIESVYFAPYKNSLIFV